MQDSAYRKRLAADLPKWLDAGWVSADGGAAILASLEGGARRSAFGLSTILGTLGALLLGLAVLAFVAAQWEAVPRLVRFALLIAGMLIAYGAAFQFARRDLRLFAEAGMLAGGLVFAGAIALIGQTYHLSGDFAGAVMLFEAGIVGAALLTGSPTMNILGLIGAGYWTWLGTIDAQIVPHWPSLIVIAIGIAVATLQNAHYGRIVAIIALMYWLVLTIAGFGDAQHWSFADGMALYVATAFALWSLGAALASLKGRVGALGEAVLWPGLFAVLFTFGILQLADKHADLSKTSITAALVAAAAAIVLAALARLRRELTILDVVAVAVLALGAIAFALYLPAAELWREAAGGALVILVALWAVALGQSGRHPIGKTIGLVAFGLEVTYLYISAIGSQLDTALALLIGGVLFIAMAYVLFRIDRLLARRTTAAAIMAEQKAPPAGLPAAAPEPTPEAKP
jgi:uncharacterized membrane protein